MEENQELALQLAQYLVELNPAQLFIATGPVLSSDQLMQAMRVGRHRLPAQAGGTRRAQSRDDSLRAQGSEADR